MKNMDYITLLNNNKEVTFSVLLLKFRLKK